MNHDRNELWKKMLEADYNYQFHIEQKGRYTLVGQGIKVLVILASTATAALWVEQIAGRWASWIWLGVAALTIVDLVKNFDNRGANNRIQAELWSKVRNEYERAYERANAGEEVESNEMTRLAEEFNSLSRQEQSNPSRRRRKRLHNEILRRHGIDPKAN